MHVVRRLSTSCHKFDREHVRNKKEDGGHIVLRRISRPLYDASRSIFLVLFILSLFSVLFFLSLSLSPLSLFSFFLT